VSDPSQALEDMNRWLREDADVYGAGWKAGAEAMRRACLAVIESQLADLSANYPGAWVAEFSANTCRAIAHAIEALPVPAPLDKMETESVEDIHLPRMPLGPRPAVPPAQAAQDGGMG